MKSNYGVTLNKTFYKLPEQKYDFLTHVNRIIEESENESDWLVVLGWCYICGDVVVGFYHYGSCWSRF